MKKRLLIFVVITILTMGSGYYYIQSCAINAAKNFSILKYENLNLKFLVEMNGGIKLGKSNDQDVLTNQLQTSVKGDFDVVKLEKNIYHWKVVNVEAKIPEEILPTPNDKIIFQDFLIKWDDQKILFGSKGLIDYKTWIMQNYQRWILRMLNSCQNQNSSNITHKFKFPDLVEITCTQVTTNDKNIQKTEQIVINIIKKPWSINPERFNIQIDESIIGGSFIGTTQRTVGVYDFSKSQNVTDEKLEIANDFTWTTISHQPMSESIREEINKSQAISIDLENTWIRFISEEKLDNQVRQKIKLITKFRFTEVKAKLQQVFNSKNDQLSKTLITILKDANTEDTDAFLIHLLNNNNIKNNEAKQIAIISELGFSKSLSNAKLEYFKNTKFDINQIDNDKRSYLFWLMRGHIARMMKDNNLELAKIMMKPVENLILDRQSKTRLPLILNIIGNSGLSIFSEKIISLMRKEEFEYAYTQLIMCLRFIDTKEAHQALLDALTHDQNTPKWVQEGLQLRIDSGVTLDSSFVLELKRRVLTGTYSDDFKSWVESL